MDILTEEIAHFVGLLTRADDEGRARSDYHAFADRDRPASEDAGRDAPAVTIRSPYDLDDYAPGVPYTPADPEAYWTFTRPVPVPEVTCPSVDWRMLPPVHPPLPAQSAVPVIDGDGAAVRTVSDPPGSVAAIVVQASVMSDQDRFDVGRHEWRPDLGGPTDGQVDRLVAEAVEIGPFRASPPPGSVDEMTSFVDGLASRLHAYALPGDVPEGADLYLAVGEATRGTTVDGTPTADRPDFAVYRPATGADGNADGSTGASMEISVGSDTLVNAATISDRWLAAKVTAVVGNYVQLDAVIQTNVWSDDDAISAGLAAGAHDPATLAFNIASFTRVDAAHPEASGPTGGFPSTWTVTEVKGDLFVLNWVEQVNYMLDGDVGTFSTSGGYLKVVGGDDVARNAVDISELGRSYDLIVVGGSIYDANVVWQTNVLFDDDVVAAQAGLGFGVAATHGNLLWNEADIVNVGSADRFSELPDAFRRTADGLSRGGTDVDRDVLTNAEFAGSHHLRVLYVSGDVVDLQFLRQTNILGDADRVAAAVDALGADGRGWNVSTGSNTLVNAASIVDVDSLGRTMVGGEVYSDEVLFQAGLVDHGQPLVSGPTDTLVTEAVAFLGDDATGSHPDAGGGHTGIHGLPLDAAGADPMHHLAA